MNNNVIDIHPFYVYFAKGEKLDGDLYIPRVGKKLPVVIMRTPYGKGNIYSLFDPVVVARLGFVVAVQNVRGRYESDGLFDPFINESYDSALTVQWLSKQSWSNGQIFSIGVSYEGFTAMMCSNSPNLTAFASILSSSNIHETWFFEGDAVRQAFVQSWSHSFAYTDTYRLSDEQKEHIRFLANNLTDLYKLPIEEFPAEKYLPYYSEWIKPNKKTDYWKKLNNSNLCNLSLVNGYYIGGWYDIFCEGTIADYQSSVMKSGKKQRLVIGPWSHNDLFSPLVGEIDFGVYSIGGVDKYDIFEWFLRILNQESCETGVKVFVMGLNKWHEYTSWPPKSIIKYLFLSSTLSARSSMGDGVLTWEVASEPGFDQYQHIKSNPVPSIGGRSLDSSTSFFGKGGPRDQREVELRNDVLVYTSESLTSKITIIGSVVVSLSVASSSKSTIFHAKLVDVFPDGRSFNILDSCKVVNFGSNPKAKVTINLGSIAHTFLEGHQIRLDISSSSYPRINIHEELLSKDINNMVFWGGNEPTWIELPVLM